MNSAFIREQQRYTLDELCMIFNYSEEQIQPFIRRLKEYGILKTVKNSEKQKYLSDLAEEDIEITKDVSAGSLYVFTFVGVIIAAGTVLKCYPKYLRNSSSPHSELKQVLKVLRRYPHSKDPKIPVFTESSEDSSFNRLSVLLFLLNDYYENGIYSNTREIYESNGSGEILWDRTISNTYALIVHRVPFYIELQTKKRTEDDFNFFKRLHRCVLTEASKELDNEDLLELFDIPGVDLSEEKIADFGEKDYILYRIGNELNTQFNTRKQLVLKALYTFIAHSGNLHDIDAFSTFGTNSFNLVWEAVCKDIFDNKLQTPLNALVLPVPLKDKYNPELKLIEIIEKPYWSAAEKAAAKTLKPDLVSISGDQFIIFDAKYYTPVLEAGKPPVSQPDIESVTKQYLYQLAYKDFIAEHGFKNVKNCFLLPSESDVITDKGTVSMEMLNKLNLELIKVRLIPAAAAYDCYLSRQKMDLRKLHL